MSLFCGIFSKRRDLVEEDWRAPFDELGHEGRRVLETRVTRRLALAAVESKRELPASRIAVNRRTQSLLLLGGEIFDYEGRLADLERCGRPVDDPRNQVEVVLHGFEEYGERFLSGLTGAFALAHHDPGTGTLTLANDSFGMHPLFVVDTGDFCLFASEIEPLMRFRGFEPRLDLQAIAEYFTVKQPCGDRTFVTGLRNLDPGNLLRTGGVEERIHYDDLAIAVDRSLDLDTAAEEMFRLLRGAVTARLRYRDHAYAALTGGLDTRLLIGLLSKEERSKVEFRTIRSTWLAEGDDLDYNLALEVARRFDLDHVIRESENPARGGAVDRSFLLRSRTLKGKGYKFEGFFGDNFMAAKWHRPETQALIRHSAPEEYGDRVREIFRAELVPELQNPLEVLRQTHRALAAENQDGLFYIHRLTRGVFTTLAGGSPYGWVMQTRQVAHGQDSIFRDTALLRYLLTVPREIIEDRRLYDRLFERHLPELCTIPTTRRCPVVPHARRAPSRHPRAQPDFAPILEEYLGSSSTWDKRLYDEAGLRQALADEDHWAVPGFADFESWYRERFLARRS